MMMTKLEMKIVADSGPSQRAGLVNLSDQELESWCRFVEDPAANHDLGTPEGFFRHLAGTESQQEVELRAGLRPGRGIFHGWSVKLVNHLCGI